MLTWTGCGPAPAEVWLADRQPRGLDAIQRRGRGVPRHQPVTDFYNRGAVNDHAYPFGDALIPDRFDEHTVIFLVRHHDAPVMSEEELDRLQTEHLTYLRGLKREGVLIANGPLAEQTDDRMRGISVYALALDEALELARADPMVRAGRLEIEGARWWTAEGTARFGSG